MKRKAVNKTLGEPSGKRRSALIANDDELERSIHEASLNGSNRQSMSTSKNAPKRKKDFAEIGNHIQLCKQLMQENKITVKNVWGINIIEYILDLISIKQEDTFKLVGNSLDVGAKVYGCRVDDVYNKTMQLCMALLSPKASRQNDSPQNDTNDEGELNEDNIDRRSKQPKLKRRRICKQTCLDATIHDGIIDIPQIYVELNILKENSNDMGASNLLNVKMSGNFNADEKINCLSDHINDDLQQDALTNIGLVSDQLNLCDSFKNFIIGPDFIDDEESQWGDLNTSIPTVELDGSIPNLLFDDDDNDDNEFEMTSNQRIPADLIASNEFLQDAADQILPVGPLNYTKESGVYFRGPHHWKIKFNKPFKPMISGVTEVIERRKGRKKKNDKTIDLSVGEQLKHDSELLITMKKKRKDTRLLPQQSYQSNYQMEVVMKNCLLLRPEVPIPQPKLNVETDGATSFDGDDDHMDLGNDFVAGEDTHCEEEPTELNLVDAPDIINIDLVPYAKTAKKMDIQNLKTSIWNILRDDASSEVKPTTFQNIYRELPNSLSANNRKALTPHLAFTAILHLANEHSLYLKSETETCGNFSVYKAN